MSNTPSRRLSLRRKRSTKGAQDAVESPASKKSSPSLETVSDKEEAQLSSSQVYTSRRTRSYSAATQPACPPLASPPHNFLHSPKSKGHSNNVKSQESNFATPQARHKQPACDEVLRQHSPDMPFLSSQLCSTQECEVVWDCDSPGFSKDDLKRMHGDGSDSDANGCGVSPLVKAAPYAHRILFPWARIKPTTSATATTTAEAKHNTTSQLNQLLDQLSNKSKAGEKKDVEVEQLLKLPDSQNEDSLSTQRSTLSSSPQLPKLLQAASSQPFTFQEKTGQKKEGNVAVIEEEDVLNLPSSVDDSVWGDELNMGICDISSINLASEESRKPSVNESESFSSSTISGIKATGALVEVSCESSDVFDDDLFNESVMQTTQAVEEALIESDGLHGPIESKGNSRYLVNNKFNEKNYVPQASHSSKKTEGDFVCEKLKMETITSLKHNYDLQKHNSSSDDQYSSSPVLGKPRTSPPDKPPQRQVRNSFRLGITDHSPQKRNFPFVQKLSETNSNKHNSNGRNLDNQFKMNPVLHEKQMKSSAYAKPLTSLDRKPAKFINSCKVESVRNSSSSTPFREIESNNEKEIYCTGKFESQKGPLLRSQSTGDAKVNNPLTLPKRCNSSAEFDTIREFEEDDEIFKSLLMALPEDDNLLEGQILQPQVNMSKHKLTNVKQDVTHLINSTIIAENSKACLGVGTEKGNAVPAAHRNPLGNVSNVPTMKSFNSESTESRKTQAQTCTKKQVATSWTLLPKSGMKEDRGEQVCAIENTELDHHSVQIQTNDMLDDDLFEDDVLTMIDEVESLYGSQQPRSEPSSSQPSQSQLVQCTQDEIARKKEAAQRKRRERKQQCHC